MIRFKKVYKNFYYLGRFKYYILYDYSSGKPNRYTVLIMTADDPVTIGRELRIKWVRELIEKYEALPIDYGGLRRQALRALKMYIKESKPI